MPTVDSYKIRVRKFLPEKAKDYGIDFYKKKNAYTGISISNPFFSSEYAPIFLKWMCNSFNKIAIFIDDYFHIYNLSLFSGKDKSSHLDESHEIGEDIYNKISSTIKSIGLDDKITIFKSSDLADSEEFQKNYTSLKKQFKDDSLFRESVIASAKDYVSRQEKRGHKIMVGDEVAINLCSEYILCDCAIFATLCDLGYDVEAYPGPEISVLEKIIKGEVNGLVSLKNRINLEVKIERKK